MRRAGLPLVALLAAAPAVRAQTQPGAVPPAGTAAGQRVPVPGGVPGLPVAAGGAAVSPAVDPALMSHLQAWELVMRGTTNFYTKCELTRKHLITNKATEFTGSILCLKPNLAQMLISEKPAAGQKPDPNNFTKYICTGKAVYEYDGQAKQVTEFLVQNGGVGDNLLLSFMSGTLKTKDILERFDMKLLKEDQVYVYLEVLPREARDRAEFEKLTMVLFNKSVPQRPQLAYLPAMVKMRKNNGQEEETWSFTEPRVNLDGIKPADFEYKKPPEGWKVQRAQVPAAAPPAGPRVARPQGTP